jgi:hypothetical protein
MECIYELVTFGIPRNAIPVGSGGKIFNHEHQEWLQRRIEMEMEALGGAEKKTQEIVERTRISPAPTPVSIASPDSTSSSVTSPGNFVFHPNDVLFGRGKVAVDHPGNAKFRRLVDVYMRKYEEAERLEKTCIAEVIVQMVKETNGRFLKQEAGGWDEVDGPAARKKVAHAFRNRNRRKLLFQT